MISTRYVPVMCALLAVALVPTWIHSYAGGELGDGRSAASVPDILGGMAAVPTDRSPTWGRRRFDTDDWIERTYSDPRGRDSVRLTVVRSYDAKTVYHHPELAVAYGTSFVGDTVHRFEDRPDIPVHVLNPDSGVRASAMYVLQYDTRYIENPIAFQIRQAGELLFSRRQPMTLYFVSSSQVPDDAPFRPAMGVRLLFAAIDALNQTAASARSMSSSR